MSAVFVATMYRWGDHERHSYVLGAYLDAGEAQDAVMAEEQSRGGKYMGEVLEFPGGNVVFRCGESPYTKSIKPAGEIIEQIEIDRARLREENKRLAKELASKTANRDAIVLQLQEANRKINKLEGNE